jgi:hypothetical protein
VLSRLTSWASLRTLIVAAGFPFVALSIGSACLDYAGEDWGVEVCDTATSSTGSAAGAMKFGVGSGSGSGSIIPVDIGPDCGTGAASSSDGSSSATP